MVVLELYSFNFFPKSEYISTLFNSICEELLIEKIVELGLGNNVRFLAEKG